jgi:hypothetical protein
MKTETIDDIIGDIRAQNQGLPEDGYALSPLVCDLLRLADRIEAAVKAYNKEITDLLREVIGGVCLHCDLQTACQEGEDGMSTTCNGVAKANHFIEQHTEPESGKDLPF